MKVTLKIVLYFRVSTKKQGASGLGLEAQEAAAELYRQQHNATVIGTYTEIESGKRSDRPELAKALAHARRARAKLVIAKLARLARSVAFVSAMMDSGVEFACCDNPFANRLTLHIQAAVDEDEGRRISERTKAALAAYKARGGVLGASRPECRNLTDKARRKGAVAAGKAAKEAADGAYCDLRPTLTKARAQGQSYRRIASTLNAQGHASRMGKQWTGSTAFRVCKRLGIE